MKPSNAKPHAGRRGASENASASQSVSATNNTPLPRSDNSAASRLSPSAVIRPRRQRQRAKGRKETGTFFLLPHAVLDSSNYRALSAHGVKLLNDLGAQFRGYNNGDQSAAWRLMHPRGWKSRDTLARAIAELLHFGLIEKTRQGGMNRCGLYAFTWLAIEECRGKLDCTATRAPSGLWKEPKPPMPKRQRKKQIASTAGVSARHGRRDNEAHAVH